MEIKTNYKEVKNEEKNGIELYFEGIPTQEERTELKRNGYRWHGIKKCWYKSAKAEKKEEEAELETLKKLNPEEVEEIAKKMWDAPEMQEYIIKKYDFYKTSDGMIIELEKVNKISITKEMWYDDETEAPEVTEKNFIIYNRYNIPGRNLEEYLQEKERLNTQGCASGRYDYKGIYLTQLNEHCVTCNWFDEHDERYFKRYLTVEEEKDYIELMKERKVQYIERLKKYFKRYGNKVRTHGYWANR